LPGSAASAGAASASGPSRALFPRHILRSRSNEADIGYLFFNVFVYDLTFGWAVLSYQFITNAIIADFVDLTPPRGIRCSMPRG
jgi:hypothetical protein